ISSSMYLSSCLTFSSSSINFHDSPIMLLELSMTAPVLMFLYFIMNHPLCILTTFQNRKLKPPFVFVACYHTFSQSRQLALLPLSVSCTQCDCLEMDCKT